MKYENALKSTLLIIIVIFLGCDKEELEVDIVNAALSGDYVGYTYTWTTLFDPNTGQRYPNDTTFNVEMPDYSFRLKSDGWYGLVIGDGDPERSDLTASLEML